MSGSYPLNGEITCAERVARWRPWVNWILVIPLYLWLTVLGYGAAVVSLAGWFAILFTGRLPVRLGDYLVAVLRYQWRVVAFLFGLTTSYPGFRPSRATWARVTTRRSSTEPRLLSADASRFLSGLSW
jgi:hypothetical protein